MKQHSLETTDIYRGAFFLCKGGDLLRVQIKGNGKRIAAFLIRGRDLDRLDKEYRSGKALVNPLQFRESLNHLRDILFKEIREDDPPSPTADAEAMAVKRLRRARGGDRDDRKGEDRGSEKKC